MSYEIRIIKEAAKDIERLTQKIKNKLKKYHYSKDFKNS